MVSNTNNQTYQKYTGTNISGTHMNSDRNRRREYAKSELREIEEHLEYGNTVAGIVDSIPFLPAVNAEERDALVPYAKVTYGNRDIVIPYEEFFSPEAQAIDTRKRINETPIQISQILSVYMNQMIVFKIINTVQDKNGKEYLVGSRLQASQEEFQRTFFEKTENGQYRYLVGNQIDAKIILVTNKGIRIDCHGQEEWLPISILEIPMQQTVRDVFKAGDKINVMITDIERDEENLKLKTFRVRDARFKMMENVVDNLTIGEFYNGKIIGANESYFIADCLKNGEHFRVSINKKRLPISLPRSVRIGDIVQLQIVWLSKPDEEKAKQYAAYRYERIIGNLINIY